jgi:NADH-quinone oxidoreductase subunit L
MGPLAVLATLAGLVQIPQVSNVIDAFLEPTFANSEFADLHPSGGASWIGLVVGAVIAAVGIGLAWRIWVVQPGAAGHLRERLLAPYRLFVNKWYFDELLDALFVRPAAWCGRFAQQQFERVVVDGVLVGGTTVVVRAGSAAVRAAQSGLLRSYAALLVLGAFAVTVYFLVQS